MKQVITLRLRTMVAALFCGALSACGFSPLYGEYGVSDAPGVTEALTTVRIRPLPDRQGQKLRQVLRERIQPKGLSAHPAYDLDVQLATRIEEVGIRLDATSSRANFILTATFFLTESGARIYSDRVQAIISYNILDEQYATVASQADAENRAIRRVGEEIKTRLAVFLRDRVATAAASANQPAS